MTESPNDTHAALEQQLADAGEAYENDPTPENLATHNAAAEALAEHRADQRSTGGPTVGGDVIKSEE
jgi:hypothetical protein